MTKAYHAVHELLTDLLGCTERCDVYRAILETMRESEGQHDQEKEFRTEDREKSLAGLPRSDSI